MSMVSLLRSSDLSRMLRVTMISITDNGVKQATWSSEDFWSVHKRNSILSSLKVVDPFLTYGNLQGTYLMTHL